MRYKRWKELHVASLDVNVISASRRCATLRMLNHQFETCTRACVRACTRARRDRFAVPLARQKRS